jgi:hypothetical protein
VERAWFATEHGIQGDAHAGNWHRQVSLLSQERIDDFNQRGAGVVPGAFGENLVVEGIDFPCPAGEHSAAVRRRAAGDDPDRQGVPQPL